MRLRKRTKQNLQILFTVLLIFTMMLPVAANFLPQENTSIDPRLLKEMMAAGEAEDKTEEQAEKNIEGTYQVIDYVNGNCFTILYGQERRDVKLIGIEDRSCSAEELQKIVADETVELAFGEKAEEDETLLAYAYRTDGTFINRELLALGLAEMKTEKVNEKYAEDLRLAQESAKGKGLGRWAK